MKATGIVRRIDDLGRVVIPKEIRRTLRIREGDPLEIFTDRNGEIILKKYSVHRRPVVLREYEVPVLIVFAEPFPLRVLPVFIRSQKFHRFGRKRDKSV